MGDTERLERLEQLFADQARRYATRSLAAREEGEYETYWHYNGLSAGATAALSVLRSTDSTPTIHVAADGSRWVETGEVRAVGYGAWYLDTDGIAKRWEHHMYRSGHRPILKPADPEPAQEPVEQVSCWHCNGYGYWPESEETGPHTDCTFCDGAGVLTRPFPESLDPEPARRVLPWQWAAADGGIGHAYRSDEPGHDCAEAADSEGLSENRLEGIRGMLAMEDTVATSMGRDLLAEVDRLRAEVEEEQARWAPVLRSARRELDLLRTELEQAEARAKAAEAEVEVLEEVQADLRADALPATDPARAIVAEQAEDEGLWFEPETAPEAYLQQELRRLHAAVESRGPATDHDAAVLDRADAWESSGCRECHQRALVQAVRGRRAHMPNREQMDLIAMEVARREAVEERLRKIGEMVRSPGYPWRYTPAEKLAAIEAIANGREP